MQFSTVFSISTLIAIAAAAKSFGAVSTHSGSDYQYASVTKSGNSITLNKGDQVEFILNDDKSLVDAKTKKYISLDSNKNLVESDKADKKFALTSSSSGNGLSSLTYDNKQQFSVNTKSKDLNIASASDNLGVGILVSGIKDVDNVYPSTSTATTKDAKKDSKTTKASEPTWAVDQKNEYQFGVVSIHTGSKFQYAAIKKVDSHPHVFSVGGDEGKDVTLTLRSDGTLYDQDQKGIYVDPKTGEFGNVAPFGRQAPSKGFKIKDGHLTYNGKDNWSACPSGDNKFSLANNGCTGGTGIALKVVDERTL
ncbi:hypothetical protein HYPBUDRAFT_153424 [Hyphopichia burtonii NRRL Y-1933]|uniref:Cell wall protein PhiA n=1 Tax=Hyphopichia burtonii NRRL Y-1933 TaxID=984485 RepID=A0A1E4RHG7_9ASCO|nr:hypothetical protein HYPBUDRAFT_153424 [Hyphopichia burtonii NRRL Y-1933]ODV66709.1 hypothetical protein HYPBUDRAFT_153424 [Hyphopichia burtonii NRRL Y-1933]